MFLRAKTPTLLFLVYALVTVFVIDVSGDQRRLVDKFVYFLVHFWVRI